jgi:hypothetical protein
MADVIEIVPLLRLADVAEISANSGVSPTEALTVGLELGAYTGRFDNGDIGCMLGAHEVPDYGTYVWLLGTNAIRANTREFLRDAADFLEYLEPPSGVLWTLSDARNTLHHRWLEWSGFSEVHRTIYGVEEREFIYFKRETYQCVTP